MSACSKLRDWKWILLMLVFCNLMSICSKLRTEIFVFDNVRFAFDIFCLVLFENCQIKVNILMYNIQVFIFFMGASVVCVCGSTHVCFFRQYCLSCWLLSFSQLKHNYTHTNACIQTFTHIYMYSAHARYIQVRLWKFMKRYRVHTCMITD